jgi:hypothetical protein
MTMPIIRPLCNTHIRLPGWLYDMVFYHYVKPLDAFAVSQGGESE